MAEQNKRDAVAGAAGPRPDDDPMVIEAISEGRHANDIWLIDCPTCGWSSYWNEGSHASCRNCGATLTGLAEAGEAFNLEDYWSFAPYPCDEPAALTSTGPPSERPANSKGKVHENS